MNWKWTSREKKIITMAIITLAIVISIIFFVSVDKEKMEHVELELVYEQQNILGENSQDTVLVSGGDTEQQEKKEEIEILVEDILVDVKGAVHEPGVYRLQDGDRVIDAVNKAGQIIEDGTTEHINLAQKVYDGMVIYVPTHSELEEGQITLPITEHATDFVQGQIEDNSSGKININQASADQLQTLPGVGASRAQAIIEYRTEKGPFQSIEEIMNISGIGSKIYERLKDMIEI